MIVVIVWFGVVVDVVFESDKCCVVKFVMGCVYAGVDEGYGDSFAGESEVVEFFYLCFLYGPLVCWCDDQWEYV